MSGGRFDCGKEDLGSRGNKGQSEDNFAPFMY